MTEKITVLNTRNGKVTRIRSKWFENEAIRGNYLVAVPEGTKPRNPVLYKPVTASEYLRTHEGYNRGA